MFLRLFGMTDLFAARSQMGVSRILETCERFGATAVMESFAALLTGAAAELRAAIKALRLR